MTLTLKPKGRGNWSVLIVTLDDGPRVQPILIQRGQTLTLGGLVWRICKVAA